MIEETKVEKACYNARQKLNELWKLWVEQYPDSVDQTLFKVVRGQIEQLRELVRLAATVKD
jgi:hypothetical protein